MGVFIAAASTAAFFTGTQVGRGRLHLPHFDAWHAQPIAKTPAPTPGTQPAQVLANNDIPPPDDPNAADIVNPNAPLTIRSVKSHGVPFVLINGGMAGTRRSPVRAGVDQIVAESGAKAGLNGTFFANASLTGTDNLLIGPSICGDESSFVFSPFDRRAELAGRPMVLLSQTRTRIYPYDPSTMQDEAGLRSRLPGLTDAFLGGVWLVHNGIATDEEKEADYHIHDAEDPRRRAFFFITNDGEPGLGATTYVAKSSQIARALPSLGIREAVLLDSGFSTSLVCGNQILVTGHTSPGIPSRPVPHAILLFASALPAIPDNLQVATADPDTDSHPHHSRRRLRRRV